MEPAELTAALAGVVGAAGKALVFFPTVRMLQFWYVLLKHVIGVRGDAWALHGRLAPQKRRGNVAAFTRADSGVLFASDLSARGLDFPAVTDVVQVGVGSQKLGP